MVEFANQSGYDRRQSEISAAERLAAAARMQEASFRNQQQDRERADALDAAEREYYSATMGGRTQAPSPSTGGVVPEIRTAGFNPEAEQPETSAQTLAATAARSGPVNPADYFGNVAGGGKILAGIEKFQRAREDEVERNAITAIRNGEWELFDHFNATAKLKIPESTLQRARQDDWYRVNMGNAALASEIYKANPQQASGFLMAYMDAATKNPNGNPQDFVIQASKVVGAPVDKPNWSIKQLVDGAMVRINENSGAVVPITMDDGSGKTIPVKGPGAKTGKDLLFQVKFDAYKKAFPGASDADALSFANGDTTLGTDPKIRATYYKIAADLLENDISAMDMPLEEKQALLASMTDDMMGGAGNIENRHGTVTAPSANSGSNQNSPVRVGTQAEFDALPSGTYYINPADGATYRKN